MAQELLPPMWRLQ